MTRNELERAIDPLIEPYIDAPIYDALVRERGFAPLPTVTAPPWVETMPATAQLADYARPIVGDWL